MPLLANTALTLADMRSQMGEDGKIQMAIDLVSQTNEIVDDMLWVEANEGMSHRTTIRTGLPAAFWRLYNQGVPAAKSTTAQITESCAMLEVYSKVDEALANLNSNSAMWRMSEDQAFVEGMTQQMATNVIYGNVLATPGSFNGLAQRYSTVNTATTPAAANVIDAGGVNSTNTSMWMVCWGPNSVHGLYPKGSIGGLQVRDVTTPAPVLDANGNSFQALQTHYKWDCGLALRDWRYVVRIANIDVTLLTGSNAANLVALLSTAVNKFPVMPRSVAGTNAATKPSGIGPVPMNCAIYVNRTLRSALELQLLNKSNILLRMEEFDGMAVLTFRGIPIRTVDVLVNTEARVV